MVTFRRELLTIHPAEHSKDVEHRQINAVAGQRPETGKRRLIFKFKRPRQRAFEIHAIFAGQFKFARDALGRVAGINRLVAVAKLRRFGTRRKCPDRIHR